METSKEVSYWCKYEYDDNNRLISKTDSKQDWAYYEYDTKGNLIRETTSNRNFL